MLFSALFLYLMAGLPSSSHHPLGAEALHVPLNNSTSSSFSPSPKGSTQLLGDLLHLPLASLSFAGALAQTILIGGTAIVETLAPYTPPALNDAAACAADTCCVWGHVVDDMVSAFKDPNTKKCTALARGAIRLGFHDAGAWSTSSAYGGADGSMVLSDEEFVRPVNRGLEQIRAWMKTLRQKYRDLGWNISAADLIQVGAQAGVASCPGGFPLVLLVGRPDDPRAAPDGLLPDDKMDAGPLVDMFSRKTLNSVDLVALLGAHSTATQKFVDPSRAGASLDSTVGDWDTLFYAQVVAGTAPFVLHSDKAVSTHVDLFDPALGTLGTWMAFAAPPLGQSIWQTAFGRAYFRLSLLGVKNINKLHDCTKVLSKVSPGYKFQPEGFDDKLIPGFD